MEITAKHWYLQTDYSVTSQKTNRTPITDLGPLLWSTLQGTFNHIREESPMALVNIPLDALLQLRAVTQSTYTKLKRYTNNDLKNGSVCHVGKNL
jgi:hypothetical protein